MKIKELTLLSSVLLLSILTVAQASPEKDALLKDSDPAVGGEYVRSQFLTYVKKPFSTMDQRKKVLLVGDSHAQDLFNVIQEGQYLNQYQLSVRYIPTRCQMYLGPEDVSGFIKASDAKVCAEGDTLAQAKTQMAEADVVILAASWQDWSADRVLETIKNLQLRPEQTLIVLGRKSFGRINARQYLRMPEAQWKDIRNPVDEQQTAINGTLQKLLPAGVFVDVHTLLCGQGDTCPVFTPEGRLISFDGGHFTPAGAKYAGPILFGSEPLKNLK